MRTAILCTLGPASINERVIERLTELGVSLFRLNLSHTKVKDAARIINFVRKCTAVPLSLDTEGAQIRTGDFVDGRISVRENSLIHAHRRRIPGDSHNFNLYPDNIIDELMVGDFIHLDADVLAQVVETDREAATLRVLNGGEIAQNKAVNVERDIRLPPLTEKDRKILAIGKELGIQHVALSFANSARDIAAIREVAGSGVQVISKIECKAGLASLDEIAGASNALLIDRGDLSREVPLEQIPAAQKHIIRRCHELGRKVYVATNLMESMATAPVPTRAEVNDVFNTLMDGADGLVLAAETAIGKYPIGCASMIRKIIQVFEKTSDQPLAYAPTAPISLLVEPHGGSLVHGEVEPASLTGTPATATLTVDDSVWIDSEEIALGVYSPLAGFMDRRTLECVLDSHRLPDGTVWPMPILLSSGNQLDERVGPGERVALATKGGDVFAILDVSERFTLDLEDVARRWFGSDSPGHPGVARLLAGGRHFLAGKVTLLKRYSALYRHYVLTPAQTRSIFAAKGWNRVAGFQTRNVPHRVHEFIKLNALETSHADGLLVRVAVEPASPGAFAPSAVLASYQTLLEFGRYPPGKMVLGAGASYRRFAGPREAVFQGLRFKNLGCSHIVIGPSCGQAGDFYAAGAARALFERLGSIGVTPVFFEELAYDHQSEAVLKPQPGAGSVTAVRSEAVRQALRSERELPTWCLREVVQNALRAEAAAGRPLFQP